MTAAGALAQRSGEAGGRSRGKIRCLAPRAPHLLRECVLINVRGQAALPPPLKAPCSSRKARAGGLRRAGSWLPCSEGTASPRVFPNRWVRALPLPRLVHVRLGLPGFPGRGAVA